MCHHPFNTGTEKIAQENSCEYKNQTADFCWYTVQNWGEKTGGAILHSPLPKRNKTQVMIHLRLVLIFFSFFLQTTELGGEYNDRLNIIA